MDFANQAGTESAFLGPDWFTPGQNASYGQMQSFENTIPGQGVDPIYWPDSPSYAAQPSLELPETIVLSVPLVDLNSISFSNQMAGEDMATFSSMSTSGDFTIGNEAL